MFKTSGSHTNFKREQHFGRMTATDSHSLLTISNSSVTRQPR